MASPINAMIDASCKCLRCGAAMGKCDCWGPDGPGTKEFQAEREQADQAFADLCLKSAEACERIAEQTGSTPEAVASEIEEAFRLLLEYRVDQRVLNTLDWRGRVRALFARLKDSKKEEDHG